MKIVLLRSVDNLGQAGEAVDVKPGYFRNYLEPRGMALRATQQNLRLVEARRKKLEALVARERASALTIQEQLDNKQVVFKLRAGDRGQLYGSVNTRDLVDRIKEDFNIEIERRRVDMEILRTLGDHHAKIRIYPGVVAHMTVTIERLILEGEEHLLEDQDRLPVIEGTSPEIAEVGVAAEGSADDLEADDEEE